MPRSARSGGSAATGVSASRGTSRTSRPRTRTSSTRTRAGRGRASGSASRPHSTSPRRRRGGPLQVPSPRPVRIHPEDLMRVRSTCVVLSVVASLALFGAGPAAAGTPEEHDGFFMRAAVGLCAGNAKLESTGFKAELKDPGLDVNVAAGYVVLPNLAVHATLWGWGLNDPDVDA